MFILFLLIFTFSSAFIMYLYTKVLDKVLRIDEKAGVPVEARKLFGRFSISENSMSILRIKSNKLYNEEDA